MQANSFAVLYSFALFGLEVTSSSLNAEELPLLYVASVKKLMAQSRQYNLDQHIVVKPQGICFEHRHIPADWQRPCEGDSSCDFLHALGVTLISQKL